MISIEYAEAFSQVLYVIEHMDQTLIDKIPKKVIQVLRENALENEDNKLDSAKNLKDMELSPKACSVLAIIYLNCLCTSEEKSEYIKLLQKNDEIYQDMENEKIGFEDIFENKTEIIEDRNPEITDMIVHKKENIFVRLINKIKDFFKFK